MNSDCFYPRPMRSTLKGLRPPIMHKATKWVNFLIYNYGGVRLEKKTKKKLE